MATTKVGIAPMKAAQVPKPGGDFEIVEREIPKPASRSRARQGASVRCLSQRLAHERRAVAGNSVSARSGTRSRGHRR